MTININDFSIFEVKELPVIKSDFVFRLTVQFTDSEKQKNIAVYEKINKIKKILATKKVEYKNYDGKYFYIIKLSNYSDSDQQKFKNLLQNYFANRIKKLDNITINISNFEQYEQVIKFYLKNEMQVNIDDNYDLL